MATNRNFLDSDPTLLENNLKFVKVCFNKLIYNCFDIGGQNKQDHLKKTYFLILL